MSTELRRFGKWAGNPKGKAEDTTRCIQRISPYEGSWISYQCSRKRGDGPKKEYCKQHTKIKERQIWQNWLEDG